MFESAGKRICISVVLFCMFFCTGLCLSRTLDSFLDGPLARVDEVVFAVRSFGDDGHWYANFGYWASDSKRMMYGKGGGGLRKINIKTGSVSTILDAGDGSVRDPYMHYDGHKLLFSYRRSDSIYFHLYEGPCVLAVAVVSTAEVPNQKINVIAKYRAIISLQKDKGTETAALAL